MGLIATYLLDTNVVSELAKRAPDRGVESRVRARQTACAIGAPTIEELAFGVARLPASAKRDMLAGWLEGVSAGFVLLPYDANCAMWLGREWARLAALGRPAPRTDGEIAAIAILNDLTLVTRNAADFRSFAGLRVESWFVA